MLIRSSAIVRWPSPVRTGKYRYVRWRWRALATCIDRVGGTIAAVWTWLRGRRPMPPVDSRNVKTILWVQLDHLGDAVLSAAVLPSLARAFPAAKIDVLAAPWNRDIFAALPQVDRVFVSRRNRFSRSSRRGWIVSTLYWGWKMRGERYDLAIDPRGEFPAALLMWIAGARRRLGWSSGGGEFLLTDVAEYCPGRHEIGSRQALLALAGAAADEIATNDGPWIEPDAAARQRAADLIGKLVPTNGPLVALHVGAGSHAKQWPLEHWRELVGRLIVEWNARVLLIGGDGDRSLAARMLEQKTWPGVTDLTGRLRIMETAALLERVDLFIGGDSGPAHLAAALAAPVLAIYSGTNDARQWRPWGRAIRVLTHEVGCSPCHREKCPLSDHPCLRGITPQRVLHEAGRLIAGAPQIASELPAGAQVVEANDDPIHSIKERTAQ